MGKPPSYCPGKFSLYTDKCFRCLFDDPYAICPDKTIQEIIGMFPIGWRFFPEKFKQYVSDIELKKSEDEKD